MQAYYIITIIVKGFRRLSDAIDSVLRSMNILTDGTCVYSW